MYLALIVRFAFELKKKRKKEDRKIGSLDVDSAGRRQMFGYSDSVMRRWINCSSVINCIVCLPKI